MNGGTPGPEALDDRKTSDDAWLDEALAQSFPASDPLPLFHGDAPAPVAPIERVAQTAMSSG